ncbi:alpha/beta hydrolase family protein [Paenibacillus residui]|uniref:Alpha/beta hydrolase family protein n=1 Tax=Paenibacillus residui TaxID=629724 RepID=A0ABW3DFM2_9BACL
MNSSDKASPPWNLQALSRCPRIFPLPEWEDGDIKALFYEGMPYQGRSTRVFAYYALPESSAGKKVPAIVLAHGGGGTAFKEWVRLWKDRGYAAIAMDLEGQLPLGKDSRGLRPGHEWGGPRRQGIFADYGESQEDQWMYHAVADVILAHSFIRTLERVDARRIGISGISWGGVIASIAAGVDHRLAFSIPVYGCGYLYEADNQYGDSFREMPPEAAAMVKRLWDPSSYFRQVSIPVLWVNGGEDSHFPLHLTGKSYEAAHNGIPGSAMCIHFGLGHSHHAGWSPPEIYAFADHVARGGKPLVQVIRQDSDGKQAQAEFRSDIAVTKAELRVSHSDKYKVEWEPREARIDKATGKISAELPEQAAAYFFQIVDEWGRLVSTPLVSLQ